MRRAVSLARTFYLFLLLLVAFGAGSSSADDGMDQRPSANVAHVAPDPNLPTKNVIIDVDDAVLMHEWRKFRAKSGRETAKRAGPPLTGNGQDVELEGANENVVAINPTNPSNIAYASLREIKVSTDGGQSFSASVPFDVPSSHLPAGDASLAFDSQGRLFATFLGSPILGGGNLAIYVSQHDPTTGGILPGYPVNVTAQAGAGGPCTDKQWLAADSWPGSPFADRLYLAWTDMSNGCNFGINSVIRSFSTNQGLTWAPVGAPVYWGSNAIWPVHLAAAPNGDLFVAAHYGKDTGSVMLFRSSDGGTTFLETTRPFPPGTATLPNNVFGGSAFPGTRFWTQGSWQPWVLPDPNTPGTLSVVACHNASEGSANVYIVRSTDFGNSWSAPQRVDYGPGNSLQVFPTAAVDRARGNIVVTWYDTRAGQLNPAGMYLLDTYAAVSLDAGLTFGQDFQINDWPFDPEANAPCRAVCPPDFQGVWANGPNEAWVTCRLSTPSARRWNGSTWVPVVLGSAQNVFAVWGASSSAIWFVGDAGKIWFYDGAQSIEQASGVTSTLTDVLGRSANDVYAVGYDGKVVRWNGAAWSQQTTGTSNRLYGLSLLPDGTAWAVGAYGTVIRYDGTSWSPILLGTQEWLMGVWAASSDDVWIAGLNGSIFHWDGASWTSVPSEASMLWDVWGNSSSDVYFSGAGGWCLHWNGVELEKQPLAGGYTGYRRIHGTGPSDIRAAGAEGSIASYDGSSWRVDRLGLSSNTVYRIGEYNGVAVAGVVAAATWTGNTTDPTVNPPGQQSILDRFVTDPASGVGDVNPLVSLLLLEHGSPNPFRWVTRIAYSLPAEARVAMTVHDVSGRLVKTIDEGVRGAGRHEVTWDGRDGSGSAVAAGTYFLRLVDGHGKSASGKLVLSR